MAFIDQVRAEYLNAVQEWREAARKGPVPVQIKQRRLAATRRLHYLQEPNGLCRCPSCRTLSLRG